MEKLQEQIALAETLNTRFCHDMAGPVSAVFNGLEFIEESTSTPEMRRQAMELLKLSAQEGLAKLQIYRIAYGRANKAVESPVEEVEEMVKKFFAHTKINVDWPSAEDNQFAAKINNEVRRLLINMATIVSRSIVYGGTLRIRKEIEASTRRIRVIGEGERLKVDDEIARVLNGKGDGNLTPENIPAYFLFNLATLKDVKLHYTASEQKIDFTAEYH